MQWNADERESSGFAQIKIRTSRRSVWKGIGGPSVSEVVSIATAEHYPWGAGCDGWHLVRGPGLSVIQERMPAGTAEVRHRHRHTRQFFYVLSGGLAVEVEGIQLAVPVGAGVEVPPGAAHTVCNPGPAPAEFLVVSQPPSHGDRELAPDTGG
jgi:mannose-6-phosphate isomerase-like protein (cupin superfamily)